MCENKILPIEPQPTEKLPWTTPTLMKLEIADQTQNGDDFAPDGFGPGPRS